MDDTEYSYSGVWMIFLMLSNLMKHRGQDGEKYYGKILQMKGG